MSILEAFVVFMIVWWMVFFIVLPFGNNYDDAPDGLAKSSPKNAHLKIKFIITTIATAIITLIVYFIMAT